MELSMPGAELTKMILGQNSENPIRVVKHYPPGWLNVGGRMKYCKEEKFGVSGWPGVD
jgi:hypothetical protein